MGRLSNDVKQTGSDRLSTVARRKAKKQRTQELECDADAKIYLEREIRSSKDLWGQEKLTHFLEKTTKACCVYIEINLLASRIGYIYSKYNFMILKMKINSSPDIFKQKLIAKGCREASVKGLCFGA